MGAVDVSSWGELYPDSCALESFGVTRNERHEAVKAWAPVAGLEAVPCAVKFTAGSETKVVASATKTDGTGVPTVNVSHVLKLQGFYPTIKAQMRARVGQNGDESARVYDIQAIAHTSGKSRTKLFCTLAPQ